MAGQGAVCFLINPIHNLNNYFRNKFFDPFGSNGGIGPTIRMKHLQKKQHFIPVVSTGKPANNYQLETVAPHKRVYMLIWVVIYGCNFVVRVGHDEQHHATYKLPYRSPFFGILHKRPHRRQTRGYAKDCMRGYCK